MVKVPSSPRDVTASNRCLSFSSPELSGGSNIQKYEVLFEGLKRAILIKIFSGAL